MTPPQNLQKNGADTPPEKKGNSMYAHIDVRSRYEDPKRTIASNDKVMRLQLEVTHMHWHVGLIQTII